MLQERDDRAGWLIGKQFLRSATSIGANVAEARSGESRKDFVHKLQIAMKEARESLYWLRLLAEAEVLPAARLADLMDETDQLIRILVSIVRSSLRMET